MPILRNGNKNFFKIWNPEMAYVLGYFAADGSMYKNRRGACYIEFTSKDSSLLYTVQRLLGSNHKISEKFKKPHNQKIFRLQIGSKDIYKDLEALGFSQAKSNILAFPQVPNNLISHFIRGYFDGDGHASITSYKRQGREKKSTTIVTGFTSGSRLFLETLLKKLKDVANITGGSLYYHKGYRLSFSVTDSIKMYAFLYKEADTSFLGRKKLVFERYFSGPVE